MVVNLREATNRGEITGNLFNMKKIITKRVDEESKYFCDKHPDRECYTKVMTQCWYGSEFDLLNIKMNLCDECMGKFYKMVKENFGVEPQEEEIWSCGTDPRRLTKEE